MRRALGLALGLGVATACARAPDPMTAAHEPPSADAARARAAGVRITMLMTRSCPVCRAARRWLTAEGHVFVERDVEADPRAAALLLAVNPRGAVPTFLVDDLVLVGFSPELLRSAVATAADLRAHLRIN
jgi:glutaredoxin